MHSSIRRKAWSKLVGVDVFRIEPYTGPPLTQHKDRAQVLLDVNRCGKRIPQRESHMGLKVGWALNRVVTTTFEYIAYKLLLLCDVIF